MKRTIPSPKAAESQLVIRFIAATIVLVAVGSFVIAFDAHNVLPFVLISMVVFGSIIAYVNAMGLDGLHYGRFFFYFYVVFGFLLPGFAQIGADKFYLANQTYSEADLTTAVVVVICGLIAFEIGYAAPRNNGRSNLEGRPKAPYRISGRGTIIAGTLMLIVGVYRIAALGFNTLFGTRFVAFDSARSMGYDTGASTGLLLLLSRQAAIAFLLTSFLYFLRRSRGRGELLAPVILSVALLANVIFNFPVNVPRSVLAIIIMSLVIVWLNTKGIKSNWVLFAAPLLLYGIAPLLSSYNRGRTVSSVGENISVEKYLLSGDFDGFQQLVNGIMYVSQHGLSWGHQIISSILFFIPRSVWEWKSLPTGTLIAEWQGYSNTNISAPIFLELYIDFGFVGVVLGLGLVGALLRRIDQLFEKSNVSDGYFLAGAVLCASLPPLLRGSLLGAIPMCAIAILLPILIQFLDRRTTLHRSHGTPGIVRRSLPSPPNTIGTVRQN